MKRVFTVIILSFLGLSVYAETMDLDTIYYDKDWKGVGNSFYASFFRIIEKNPKNNYRKLFRDYYITGELQCEGGYISIDKYDDSKSVMDGECTYYYKSGNIKQKATIENGKREGEYLEFYENGNIIVRANYHNDQLHGLCTEFNENGLCFQQEYNYGEPRYNYYVLTNDNGLYSKINIFDNTPVYTSPNISEQKIQYINGDTWPYYIHDGLKISMTNTRINDYGKYYRIHLIITNNSFFPVDFDPAEVSAILETKKGEKKELEIQSAKQYDKRIRRTQKWEEALTGLAYGLAAVDAGYSTSTTTSNYSGSRYSYGQASAYGSGGYASGSYSGSSYYYGSSTSTTRTYDAKAAYFAQLAASQQLAEFSDSNFRIRQARQEGYLKKTTINPGESIQGYFNIKRKDGDTLFVTINIGGAEYQFPWNVK
jgi:antitoxin component YwqK of YwqJK toxin-antitoxin module